MDTKEYRLKGRVIHVDKDLCVEYLDRLNLIRSISITSICAGHKDVINATDPGERSYSYPEFTFLDLEYNSEKDPQKTYNKWKSIFPEDTKTGASLWNDNGWVLWTNQEGWRFCDKGKDPRKEKREKVSIHAVCNKQNDGKNIKELNDWWKRLTESLEKYDSIMEA